MLQMSVNNPNFPVGQGDRRVDDTQKQELLTRIPKGHIGSAATAPLALNMSHAVSTYQVFSYMYHIYPPIRPIAYKTGAYNNTCFFE